jgi:hypothetical protein
LVPLAEANAQAAQVQAHTDERSSTHLPALSTASTAPVATASTTAAKDDDWLALEKVRLLWFVAGVLATSVGVWLGATFLK